MANEINTTGISRLEIPAKGTFGWQVRLQRRGVKTRKFFSDGQFGGSSGALQHALRWRDETLSRISRHDPVRICLNSARNQSGVVGVSKITVSGPNGIEYHFWQATWCPSPGERRSIRFSIRRHGDKGAFRLAVSARINGISGK